MRSAREMNPSAKFTEKFYRSFLMADDIQYQGHESSTRQTNTNCVQHIFQRGVHAINTAHRNSFSRWVNLMAADFAAQRLALPNACEISCRAWP